MIADFVAQNRLQAGLPLADLPYCHSDRYAKCSIAIEHCDPDLDLCDLPFEAPRHQRLAE